MRAWIKGSAAEKETDGRRCAVRFRWGCMLWVYGDPQGGVIDSETVVEWFLGGIWDR